MFDADYFGKQIHAQIEQLGDPMVEVHLVDKRMYRIKRILFHRTGYVVLEVHPPEGGNKEALNKRRRIPIPSEEVRYDQVAIPYDQIAHVYLTVKDPEAPREPIDHPIHQTTINLNNSPVQFNSPSATQKVKIGA